MRRQAPLGQATMAPPNLSRVYKQARLSGVLSLAARELKQFPPEVCSLLDHLEPDEKFWECVDLSKADLSHNQIPAIPAEVSKMLTLKSLKITHNKLTRLPDELFQLVNLTVLDVSNNEISGEISASLGNLTMLTEMAMAENQISKLPDSLSNLQLLEKLILSQNKLMLLPSTIGDLSRLQHFSVTGNLLAKVPDSIGGLQQLRLLELNRNKITHIPDSLAQLKSLTYLDCRENALSRVPKLPIASGLAQVFFGFNSIREVPGSALENVKLSLMHLDLRDNSLSTLPAEIVNLQNLKTLDLSNNDLSDLPHGLGYLKHLHRIAVDGNPLRAIRRGVVSSGNETFKKYLRSRGPPQNGIDTLPMDDSSFPTPEAVAQVTKDVNVYVRDARAAGILELADSKLQVIPSDVLTDVTLRDTLHTMNLSRNQIEVLPTELQYFNTLRSLSVDENKMVEVPEFLGEMQSLQVLQLRRNLIGDGGLLARPLTTTSISNTLLELDLSSNRIQAIPPIVFGFRSLKSLLLSYNTIKLIEDMPWRTALPDLTTLDLSNNKIEALGDCFLAPSLTSLNVSNNDIRQIPAELGLCIGLKALLINGNPQKTVRANIVAQGTEAIVEYLKGRLPIGFSLTDLPAPAPESVTLDQQVSRAPPVSPPRAALSRTAQVVPAQHQTLHGQKKADDYLSQKQAQPQNQDNELFEQKVPKAIRGGSSIQTGGTQLDRNTPSGEDQGTVESASVVSGSNTLFVLQAQIEDLEREVEYASLSQAKRFALKKELAMKRSQKIREERRLASRG